MIFQRGLAEGTCNHCEGHERSYHLDGLLLLLVRTRFAVFTSTTSFTHEDAIGVTYPALAGCH